MRSDALSQTISEALQQLKTGFFEEIREENESVSDSNENSANVEESSKHAPDDSELNASAVQIQERELSIDSEKVPKTPNEKSPYGVPASARRFDKKHPDVSSEESLKRKGKQASKPSRRAALPTTKTGVSLLRFCSLDEKLHSKLYDSPLDRLRAMNNRSLNLRGDRRKAESLPRQREHVSSDKKASANTLNTNLDY